MILLFIGSIMFSFSSVSADVISPKKQIDFGIQLEDVVCKEGLFKIIKASTGNPVCVEPSSAEKLVKKGWAKPIDTITLEDASGEGKKVGTVKGITIVPIATNVGKLKTQTPTAGYNFVFEACSKKDEIKALEVVVRSDSDLKHFTLAENIPPMSCVTSAVMVKAANPNSISAEIINKGEITRNIISLEDKIKSLKEQITKERTNLPNTKVVKPDEKTNQTITQTTDRINTLRKELNEAQGDLYTYLFALYTTSKTDSRGFETMSFSGTPIHESSANILSVTKAIRGEKTHDVVFEVCAGSEIVKLPIVTISSGIDAQKIKIGDKISPKSCQMTSVKLQADNINNISVTLQERGEAAVKIDNMERKILDLQNTLAITKKNLNEIIHKSDRPEDFNQKISEATSKISQLREEITLLRAQLNNILMKTYQ